MLTMCRLTCCTLSAAPLHHKRTGACRSIDEDTGSPRAEPSKLLQSKWVMAALAVAVLSVGLYAFRDTFLAGSVNSRLVRVYALLYQVSPWVGMSQTCVACALGLLCTHVTARLRAGVLPGCAGCSPRHVQGLTGSLQLSRGVVQAKEAAVGALKQLPWPEIPHGEEGLIESVWLLLTSVVTVPLVCKLPGGSPVLGFLVRSPSAALILRVLRCRVQTSLQKACGWCGQQPSKHLVSGFALSGRWREC